MDMKVVIDKAIPYVDGVLEPYAETLYRDGGAFSREDAADADMLVVRTRTRCDAALLEGSAVKLIATATIGFDHIDMEYCAARGIEVVTAEGCNAAGVLQWVAGVLAMSAAAGGMRPENTTLGIVGVGHVGSLVERYARDWGFRVLRCDPPRAAREGGDFVSLDEIMAESDIVTLHTPLDASTRHMIDSRAIGLMRPDGMVVNASRGEVADTRALLDAPQRLFLDVWEREPDIDRRLLEKAVVATPHIAGYSAQGKANATAAAVAAAARRFGLPLAGWYPPQVHPAARRAISWEEMCATVRDYCDLAAQSATLKSRPEAFESLRNGYDYREEYF